jgi:uncharacterized protein YkwD
MYNKLLFIAFLILGLNLSADVNSQQLEKGNNAEAFKAEMLKLVNQTRSEGCQCGNRYMPPAPPLNWNNKLEKAAESHAKDMNSNKFIGHRGSNGSKIGDRIKANDYFWKAVGENVSWGPRTVEAAVAGWKDSPSHCITLMSPSYKEMGAANEGKFWVQDFGRKMEE